MTAIANMKRRHSGFTLIEVLVALAIIALGLAAVIQAAGQSTANASALRDRTFAHWVAMNKLTEMQVQGAWRTGRQDSERTFAGRDWPVQVEIQETPYDNLHRADIRVYDPDDDEATVSTLTGLLLNPARKSGS
ncbi:MAG: type II secretion system minor pseudopilin GspI [Ectothiorhodospiraceae bacterium]